MIIGKMRKSLEKHVDIGWEGQRKIAENNRYIAKGLSGTRHRVINQGAAAKVYKTFLLKAKHLVSEQRLHRTTVGRQMINPIALETNF